MAKYFRLLGAVISGVLTVSFEGWARSISVQKTTDHAPIKRPRRVRLVIDNDVRRESYWPARGEDLGLVYPGTTPDTARAVLAEMTAVFDSLDVRHFIADGTLLGFIREGGFINGDNDIDVRFDWTTCYDTLISAFEAAGFTLTYRSWTKDRSTNLAVHKNGIMLDMLGTEFGDGFNMFHLTKYARCYLSYRTPYSGVERRDFDGLSLWVPKDPERELAACYGPNWRKPVEEWRSLFSHQGLYQCTGRIRELIVCAVNIEETQRCLNGKNSRTRPHSLREMAGIARSLVSMRRLTDENCFL